MAPAQVLEQLERMLQSGVFRGAARSSRLLRFLVEETVAGRSDRLKDYTLGAEALGRGDSFDPRSDPIARVEASRLRSRLELYYATEGAADPVVISLPKGGYVPVFERRERRDEQMPDARVSAPAPHVLRRRLWWRLSAVAGAFVLGAAAVLLLRPTAARPQLHQYRLEVATPPTTDPVSLTLSPDGRQMVFVATAGGTARLWLRPLDSSSAPHSLGGTEHASLPFWSPDSRSIGFFADSKLKRIDLDTGVVAAIAEASVPAGASWNADGTILFPMVPDSPLYRVPASGGLPEPVTSLDAGQTGHRGPQFLPEGRRFLYYVMGDSRTRGVHAGDLEDGRSRRLLDADAPALYAAGHIFFVQQGTLFARAFDPATLAVGNPQRVVAEGVALSELSGIAAISVSNDGTIAYRTGSAGGKRRLVLVDRASGQPMGNVGPVESRGPFYPALSADQRRLAGQRTTGGNTDIEILDLPEGRAVRFTDSPHAEIAPVWSPSGEAIAYSSRAGGSFNLYWRDITASAGEPLLPDDGLAKQATDWSRSGFVLFRRRDPVTGWDVMALSLNGDPTPMAIRATRHEERDAQFSPDGEWIAYQKNDTGRFEIYVQRFPTGEARRASTGGGVQARWNPNGRELFYISLEGELMAVPVTVSADRRVMEAGAAAPLFPAGVGSVQDVSLPHYVVLDNGRRFLLDRAVEEQAPPVSVVLNWSPPSE